MPDTLEELDGMVQAEMGRILAVIDERLVPLLVMHRSLVEGRGRPGRADGGGREIILATLRATPGNRMHRRRLDDTLVAAGFNKAAAHKTRQRLRDSGLVRVEPGHVYVLDEGATGDLAVGPGNAGDGPIGNADGIATLRDRIVGHEAGEGVCMVEHDPDDGVAEEADTAILDRAERQILELLAARPMSGIEMDDRLGNGGIAKAFSVRARTNLRADGLITADIRTGLWSII